MPTFIFITTSIISLISIILIHKAKQKEQIKRTNQSIKDFLVQEDEDGPEWLNRKSQNVNIRLCLVNNEYDKIIKNIVKYMIKIMKNNFIDHDVIKGISGTDIGIPLNIVIINNDTYFEPIFNPKILTSSAMAERNNKIEIEYYDYAYTYRRKIIGKPKSLILQHEVNHIDEILTIDKKYKFLSSK